MNLLGAIFHIGLEFFGRTSDPKICNLGICLVKYGIPIIRTFNTLLQNFTDNIVAVNSSLGNVRLFIGTTLFFESQILFEFFYQVSQFENTKCLYA